MRLDAYHKGVYDLGKTRFIQILWYFLGSPVVRSSFLPFSILKVFALRLFGASVGNGVRVKPGVRVKFPWRLEVGDYSWIGEGVWIDNLANVSIGSHVCISQEAYLCTGDHDWSSESFDLRTLPITIEDHVWIGARVNVAPGTTVKSGAVITLGSVAKGEIETWGIYSGNPAQQVRKREITKESLRKQKILFINETYAPDESATAQVLGDLCGAIDGSANITVLTGSVGYLDPLKRYPSNEKVGSVNVIRTGRHFFSRKKPILRILNALLLNIQFLFRRIWIGKCDIAIYLTSPPLLAHLMVCLFRGLAKKNILWLMDMNPEQVFEAQWIKRESFFGKALRSFAAKAFCRFDRIIVLDRFMADRLKLYGVNPQNIFVCALWTTPQHTSLSHHQNMVRLQYGWRDEFVVMYSGNFSLCHPLNTILQSARELRDNAKVRFIFCGGGPRHYEIKSFITENELTNVSMLGYQPHSSLHHFLSAADLHVVSFGSEYIGILHPSKIYGILGVGRPSVLIGPESSFIYEEVIKKKGGWRIDHGDSRTLIEIILKQANASKQERERMNKRCLLIAKQFNRKDQISRCLSLLGIDINFEYTASPLYGTHHHRDPESPWVGREDPLK